MELLLRALAEVDCQFYVALKHLRHQQAMVAEMKGADDVCRVLLSSSLRSFAILEDGRNDMIEAVAEHLPLQRELKDVAVR